MRLLVPLIVSGWRAVKEAPRHETHSPAVVARGGAAAFWVLPESCFESQGIPASDPARHSKQKPRRRGSGGRCVRRWVLPDIPDRARRVRDDKMCLSGFLAAMNNIAPQNSLQGAGGGLV